MNNNPFEPPLSYPDERPKSKPLGLVFSMMLLPAMVGVAAIFVCEYLDKTLGWNERAVSFFLGFPSALFAIWWATFLWRKGHRAIAIAGVVCWGTVAVFAAWATLAF